MVLAKKDVSEATKNQIKSIINNSVFIGDGSVYFTDNGSVEKSMFGDWVKVMVQNIKKHMKSYQDQGINIHPVFITDAPCVHSGSDWMTHIVIENDFSLLYFQIQQTGHSHVMQVHFMV
jgi:hypothetical protein